MYLIETSTCISIIRSRLPAVLSRLKKLSADDIGISSITAAELYHGAALSGQPEEEVRRMRSLLEILRVLNFGTNAAISYGVVCALLERTGRSIGRFDMLIAGHALSEDATLVTHNTREFRRVPGLAVEDWLE